MSSWMYSLVNLKEDDCGGIKLCEVYLLDFEAMFLPISWFEIFRSPRIILTDIISELRYWRKIPSAGELRQYYKNF